MELLYDLLSERNKMLCVLVREKTQALFVVRGRNEGEKTFDEVK